MYAIYQMSPEQVTFMRVGAEDTLPEAITFASRYHGLKKPDITLTVEVEGTKVPLASFSTRRIVGDFEKQVWGGRKGDDAISCGQERFDATMYILTMPYEQVIAVRDNHDTSDNIGQAHVDWHGPHCVDIVDSMCDFFGVAKLAEITADHFSFVVKSRQMEVDAHRRAAQLRLRPPKHIQTPNEAARELVLGLAKLEVLGETRRGQSAADSALAQALLSQAIRQCRKIVGDAATHSWDVAVVVADDADPEEHQPGTRH